MPNLIDLTGNKYGNWIVLSKAQSKKGKVYWNCKCQVCGKEKEIQGTHLKNNTFLNCCKEKDTLSKKCIICGKEFKIKSQGYTRKYCYDCSPSYKKENRQSNITAIRHAIKKRLIEYKGGKCEKCGYNKCIWALQFHHINPEEKDFDLSEKYNNGIRDMNLLYKEADKCQLLCANCHFEAHEEEFSKE